MTEERCRYIVDTATRRRCHGHATETHADAYYKEPVPVCKKHKRALRASVRKAMVAK